MAKNDYRMPIPEVGQIVHYRHEWNDKETAAIVASVGAMSVDLHFWKSDGTQAARQGVRYKSDPALVNNNVAKNGFWDYTPRDQKYNQIVRLWPTFLEVCGTDEAGLEEIITKKRLAEEEAAIDARLAEDKRKAKAEKERLAAEKAAETVAAAK